MRTSWQLRRAGGAELGQAFNQLNRSYSVCQHSPINQLFLFSITQLHYNSSTHSHKSTYVALSVACLQWTGSNWMVSTADWHIVYQLPWKKPPSPLFRCRPLWCSTVWWVDPPWQGRCEQGSSTRQSHTSQTEKGCENKKVNKIRIKFACVSVKLCGTLVVLCTNPSVWII